MWQRGTRDIHCFRAVIDDNRGIALHFENVGDEHRSCFIVLYDHNTYCGVFHFVSTIPAVMSIALTKRVPRYYKPDSFADCETSLTDSLVPSNLLSRKYSFQWFDSDSGKMGFCTGSDPKCNPAFCFAEFQVIDNQAGLLCAVDI